MDQTDIEAAIHKSSYIDGLCHGFRNMGAGVYDPAHEFGPWASAHYVEGYRDALDDSDDMPEPFDPEETFVS